MTRGAGRAAIALGCAAVFLVGCSSTNQLASSNSTPSTTPRTARVTSGATSAATPGTSSAGASNTSGTAASAGSAPASGTATGEVPPATTGDSTARHDSTTSTAAHPTDTAGNAPPVSSPVTGASAAPTTSPATTASTATPLTNPAPTTTVLPATPGVGTAYFAADIDPAARAVITKIISRARAKFGSSDGVSVAVAARGQVVGSWVAGHDVSGTELQRTARFRLASISKVLTSLTVMRLAEAGAIDLDKPFFTYWKPSGTVADGAMRTVTVRQLLTHGSGVQKLRDTFFGQDHTWQETATRAASVKLATIPGTRFDYSNANFTILGMVIETVTGLSYNAAVDKYVLGPMGVTTAYFPRTTQQEPGDPVYKVGAARHYLETLGPAGSWALTADDLARVAGGILPDGTTLLSSSWARTRRTASPLDTRDPAWRYALGLMLFSKGGWGHTGSIESASNFVITMPNGYTLTVLTSTQSVNSGGTVQKMFQDDLTLLKNLAIAPAMPAVSTPGSVPQTSTTLAALASVPFAPPTEPQTTEPSSTGTLTTPGTDEP